MNVTRYFCGLCMLFFSWIQLSSQATIRGRISDTNGEVLIGASVYLKENPSIGVSADLDGLYSLSVEGNTTHILVIQFVSYETIYDTVRIEQDEILIRNFILASSSVNLGEVKVVAKQERRNQYYMESIKKNSASTLDYMSGDMMSKIGDNNVSAAIARVTGVATNGNFITVRGLGDRYVQTCVNGSLIPTLDPFTNNIKLDLFPSSFVDNIIITKTASSDYQGDWSAAYISIETKDNPDKLSIAIETKFGFNPQSTFKKIITNKKSSTDWLGYDNGFRDIDHSKFTKVIDSPTSYEEFCALGLEGYYRSLGITSSWDPASNVGKTYFKLGLIQLGLLGKAYINDDQAISKATQEYYEGEFQNDAFQALNQGPEESLNDFANNWNTFEQKAPLNFYQTFSIGNQSKLLGKSFGFLGGFRYGNSIQYDPNSTFTRTIISDLDSLGNPFFIQKYEQQFAKYTSGWTGLLTANIKTDENNSFTVLFMPNLIGTNSIREGVDQVGANNYRYAFLQGQFYEERSQFVYQYKSQHYIVPLRAKLHFSASYADGSSSAPDFKSLQYFSEDSIHYQLDKTISNVRRNFRYLDENIFDGKAIMEISLREKPGYVSKLEFGGSYTDKEREFTQYDYLLQLAKGVTSNFTNNNLNELFSDEKFNIHRDSVSGLDKIDLYYRKFDDPANHTIGFTKVYSGFLLLDESITEKIRLSGGVRAEYSEIFTDVKLFDDLHYEPDDLRRKTPEQSFILTPSNIKKWNILPSINCIYQLRNDEITPSNLRLNYSRSIARPSIREYTESVVRDFEFNDDVFGNADLKFVEVDNYDMRYENYLRSGNYVSVSLFYKKFKNHIELTSSNFGFTWSNADRSHVYGLELEGRVKIGSDFEFRSNISVVKSYTQVEDRRLSIENGIKSWEVIGIIERTMFGQAPYVINAILNYTGHKGFSASVSYNVQGAKLVLTSIDSSPNIYEMPKNLVNLKLTQSLGKHYAISFSISDILNEPVRRSYKYEQGYLLDFDYYRFGSDFSIGVTYNL